MRWLISWTLYLAGDLVSRWNDSDARFTETGFRLYQWLMCSSSKIQGPGDIGPWRETNL